MAKHAPWVPTPTQARVLALLAEGRTVAQVGAVMFISASTVKTHLSALYQELGARNAAHAVHLAHGRGLLGAERVADGG